MLLRSLSAPIFDHWLPQHSSRSESSPETESQLQRKAKSFSLFPSKLIDGHSGELLHHKESVLKPSEDNKKTIVSSKQRRSSFDETTSSRRKSLDPSSTFLVERLFSSSGLGEKATDAEDRLETLVSGGSGCNGGGKICNGGGVGGSGVDDGGGSQDENSTEAYYMEMIESNPGNSLLTGNYAKFLKEVKGDMKKAEEYCERAILGNTNDGNVLTLYADLILENHHDNKRANSYYQQAVNMSPEDCYVQASYAKFLWDVEESEDEEEEEEKDAEISYMTTPTTTTTSFHDFPQHTSITTSS